MAMNANMQGSLQNARGRMQSSNPQMASPIQRPANTGVVGPRQMPQRPGGPMGPGGAPGGSAPPGMLTGLGNMGARLGAMQGQKPGGWNPGMGVGQKPMPQMPQWQPQGQTPGQYNPAQAEAVQRQQWAQQLAQAPQAPPPPSPMQMTPAALGTAQASAQQALQRNMGAMQSIAPQAAPGPQTPQGLNPNILAALQQRRGF